MTTLTARQLGWLHAEVGPTPVDADLQTSFDELASVRDVAIRVIRTRLNAMIEQPATVTLSGVASVSYAENIKAL
jgi:flagellar motor switch protein FliM